MWLRNQISMVGVELRETNFDMHQKIEKTIIRRK